MKATAFDQRFDQGDDVSELLDLSAARRPGYESQTVAILVRFHRQYQVQFPDFFVLLSGLKSWDLLGQKLTR